MGLQINTNLSGLNALRQLQKTNTVLNRGLEQLATGLRINRAADDASGLAIAERFRAEVLQYSQEVNNLQSGVSAVQTADGALSTQADATQRLRELALQATNGTLTDEQRSAINQEAQQLLSQIDETAQNTEFNGTQLLNGSQSSVSLGAGGNQVNLSSSTTTALGLNGLDLSTQTGAQNALGTIDTAISRIDQNRSSLGAQQNRFERAIEVRETGIVNSTESESRIRDLDVARQTIEQSRNQILLQGGLSAVTRSQITAQTAARLLGG
ncbi:MAG: flagellin FliC [Candidatus Hydrogenedentes bacterium]|nr:flagellin FliC [Candidatus Hydrogenedentota bacterium]